MAEDWKKRRKVASLPGAKVDAAMVLARTLDKAQAGEIAGVAVVIRWQDGSHDLDWSAMEHSEFSHMAMCMLYEALTASSGGPVPGEGG